MSRALTAAVVWQGARRGAARAARRLLRRAHAPARGAPTRADCCAVTASAVPVVVVGNLTVGGTGKTPLVAWLAGELSGARLSRRHRVARLRQQRERRALVSSDGDLAGGGR